MPPRIPRTRSPGTASPVGRADPARRSGPAVCSDRPRTTPSGRPTVVAALLASALTGALGLVALAALGRASAAVLPAATGAGGSAALGPSIDLPYADPGPYRTGRRRVEVAPADSARFNALLYYPALETGENAPLDPAGGPYPAVTFGHGFFQMPDRYSGTLGHLASWGFLVIAIESEAGLSPDHARFAANLAASLTWLEQANADPASWLHGQVRTDRFGASGHSMGGGASILATAADPRILALANLAAADTRPSALAAMSRVHVPVHLIVGSQDGIVPAESTRRMYDAASAPRLFTSITGGSHCGFQTDPFPVGCDRGTLPADEQLALTAHLLTAFFRLYLTDDGDWNAVWGTEAGGDPRLVRTADPGATPTPPTAPPGATPTPTPPTIPPGATPTSQATPNAPSSPSATSTPGATPAATGTDSPTPAATATDAGTPIATAGPTGTGTSTSRATVDAASRWSIWLPAVSCECRSGT